MSKRIRDNAGYRVETNANYEVDEEFREPEYLHGPHGEVNDAHVELRLARARAVCKKNKVALEAELPYGNVGTKADQDGKYIGMNGGVGQIECHVGPLGAEIKGPCGGGEVRFGGRGIQAEIGNNALAGNVQIGPVKVGADIGVRGALRFGYGGLGAMVPGFGGAIIAKDGFELEIGPVCLKIGW